jgi:GrpB-like predicted nucleotidyltransferase (UPF0157 family)
MMERVHVVPYDPGWPFLLALERSRVEAAIGPWMEAVEHVGSTAVLGLDAKPVIDLMVGLCNIRDAEHCIRPLERIGYSCSADDPELDRHRLFVRFANLERTSRTHNLHIVEAGSEYWEDHLLFRDYLLSFPETANEYARLKNQLAERFRDDRERYTEAKTGFVSAVVERAKASQA